jgi:xylulokinase
VGAAGAAIVAGIGLGVFEYKDIPKIVPALRTYFPTKENQEIYAKNYQVFKSLYKANKKAFEALNK